ncbi:hypothetical protein RB195_002237 [Necator americanus]|uniref:Uncharacterized protein n=1 Tax=Necator americanus TaxID=51031 RepID=A0ABR1DI28_NECAM
MGREQQSDAPGKWYHSTECTSDDGDRLVDLCEQTGLDASTYVAWFNPFNARRAEQADDGDVQTSAPLRSDEENTPGYDAAKICLRICGNKIDLQLCACTLASEAAIEDLMMQARKIKYDVIGLTETRRRHPLDAI